MLARRISVAARTIRLLTSLALVVAGAKAAAAQVVPIPGSFETGRWLAIGWHVVLATLIGL
jgi:hypothetical protein